MLLNTKERLVELTGKGAAMQFTHSQESVSTTEIDQIETEMGLKLPESVRSCYLAANGGVPSPYVFTNDDVDTVVSELLPLKATKTGTAVQSYKRLVVALKLVPTSMFPFAIDGGGDYFLVDCRTVKGRVYLYRGNTDKHNPLVDLELDFDDFWASLKSE